MKSAAWPAWKIASLLLLPFFVSQAFASGKWDGKILRVKDSAELTVAELAQDAASARYIVLGEKHDVVAIQRAQAAALRAIVSERPLASFTLGWEFLNARDQSRVRDAYELFRFGSIDGEAFLTATQGSASYRSYIPILEAVRDNGGDLWALNLSREEKAPVVQGGLSAIDPKLIPPGFEMGSANYFARFEEAMGGHSTPGNLRNYFEAQCLTDDVMAYQLVHLAPISEMKFFVGGGFHTDYFDGTVARIRARDPRARVAVIRFVDSSDDSESGLRALPVDPRYGAIADYVWFVGEPAPESSR